MLPAGQTIDKVVSPATMALVSSRLDALACRSRASAVQALVLAITMMAVEWQKAGFDSALGLDKHFTIAPRPKAKPCRV